MIYGPRRRAVEETPDFVLFSRRARSRVLSGNGRVAIMQGARMSLRHSRNDSSSPERKEEVEEEEGTRQHVHQPRRMQFGRRPGVTSRTTEATDASVLRLP